MSVLETMLGGKTSEAKTRADLAILEALLGGGSTSKSGAVVSEQAALRVSAVAGCVRAVSQDVAQLPLKLMQEKPDGTKLPARGHPLYRVLHDRPNAWQTSMGFRGQLGAHAALGKGGYALVTRVGGQVRELLPAPYGSIRVKQDPDWTVHYFARNPSGPEFEVPARDLLRVEGLSWTGLGGHPAVDQAREAIGLAMATEESQANLHRTGARPAGLLSTEASFAGKPEMADRVRENWLKAYGPAGGGGVAVLDAGMKFQALTMTGVDAQHLETRRFQIEEVCRIMGVPPTRIGYSDKASTYASAAQFAQDYVMFTLQAWVTQWEQALSLALLTEQEIAEGYIFRHEMKGLLRGDPAARATYFTAALGTASSPGWMSPNDVRRAEDQDPLTQDGADLVVTLKNFSGQAPPAPPAAELEDPEDEDPADDMADPEDAPPAE